MEEPRRKLVIHAGMHKTGSTAIQYWLKNTDLPDVHYFEWERANHGQMFVLMFQENPNRHHSIARLGLSDKRVQEMGREQKARIQEQVRSSDRQTFVFSAERISAAPENAIVDMKEFFSELFDDIQVYAYVRGPSRFMASMFQQHLKRRAVKPSVKALWPNYRKRIGHLFQVFGEDRVHIRAFDNLAGNTRDVVADFAGWTGISDSPKQVVKRNTAMSAEAASLLYFFRKFIEPDLPNARKKRANEFLRKTVMKMPGEAFDLQVCSGADLDPAKREDMEWMSKTLGVDIDDFDKVRTDRRIFRAEEDLIEYAVKASHLLNNASGEAPLVPSASDSVEKAIERWRSHLRKM